MVKLVVQCLFVGLYLYLQVLVVFAVDIKSLNIWPMPQSVSHGHQILHMSKEFELMTEGSKYPDASGILKDGVSRLLDVVQAAHVVDGNFSHFEQSVLLQGIHVVIFSPNDELQYGIDESYKLSIPASGNLVYAHLEAQTVYGALHGLQTFSQLCHFNFTKRVIEVHQVPWNIIDQPRFSYRGLLIDTSRHYLPLPMIKKVIDSMAYTKLNVLHWHIVDSQSFPLEIPSYPKLWVGAYSISERYTMADAAEIVSYAQKRGINVLAEIDVPGHALSWGIGYPSLWPSKDCQQPLDVSNEFTFKVIDGILSDFNKIFKFKFVHLGGDEVDTSGIIGLGEAEENRVGPLHTHATLRAHPKSVPINALVSVKGTPLEDQKPVEIWEMMRMIGTAHIVMPKAMVRLSAGRVRFSMPEQTLCFLAGANSIFTGDKLLTTPNNDFDADQLMFKVLGLIPKAPSFPEDDDAENCAEAVSSSG